MTRRSRAGWPVAADFAAPPTDGRPPTLGRGRPRRPTRATGPRPRAVRRRRHRCVLRCPSRAHALPHRLHARRWRGEGRRIVGTVPALRRSELILFADSRYTIQASREAPEARIETVYGDLPTRWPELVASIGREARRGRGRPSCHRRPGQKLAAAAPDVELVPIEGWIEADRATKEPARSSSGSPRRVRSPTGRSPRCSRRSGQA